MNMTNYNTKKMLLFSFMLFSPLLSFQKSTCMNAKYFDVYPGQQQRNLNPNLLLTEAKNHAAKIKSESVQIYSKNGTNASIPRFSTSRLLEMLLNCMNHPMVIFNLVWLSKPQNPNVCTFWRIEKIWRTQHDIIMSTLQWT